MYIKFSKSFDSLFEIKKSFFQNNKSLISENKKLLKILKKQPLRLRCKNCSKKLGKSFDFNSHGINYKFCKNCDHLNSENEDTKSFHNFYEKSQSYSKFYISSKNDFNKRVKNIYTPKLEFLLGYFKNRNKAKIIDLGTGIGHFLKACENKKVQALGLEINSKMIDYGNKFLKKII